MKVVVYGAGGVGGYFGARLAQAGAQVHLLARGAHLEALKRDGLRILSPKGNVELRLPATEKPQEVGSCDCVLFCVKSTDTEQAADNLAPLLGPDTFVLSLQNGIDNEAKIAARIGPSRVLAGVTYIFSTLDAPGVVHHTGGPARIIFGELAGARSERAQRLLSLFSKAQVEAELSLNIEFDLWTKFSFICALSGMTAATRKPLGVIRSVPETRSMFQRLLEETWAVARAEGVPLPGDIVEKQMAQADRLGADSRSSLHYDLVHGKPMELEALQGTVVRLSRKHGLASPMSEAVYALLKPWVPQ